MFKMFKKEEYLCSVAKGQLICIEQVPDRVFSQKILGEGFGIIPMEGDFCSPADGVISDVAETLHAYCITTDDGLEIIVHIGIDTVELKGEGFKNTVKSGAKVKKGDIIAHADLTLIQSKGYNPTTAVIVTNSDRLSKFQLAENTSVKIGDKAMIYKI